LPAIASLSFLHITVPGRFPFDREGKPPEIFGMIGTPRKSFLVLVIAGLSLCSVAKAQVLTLAQCPAVVQSAIQNNGQGGVLEAIKLLERDGSTLYVAEVGLGDKRDLKMYITPEGAVVRSRREIDFREVPAAVRRTVLGLTPAGATVSDVDMETAEGVTTYVVDLKLSETLKRKITLKPDGTVLSEEDKTKSSN
jgi:uncharacterized membrane protein YkoI